MMMEQDLRLQEMYDSGMTLQQIADDIDKTRKYVRARVRLPNGFTCDICGEVYKNRDYLPTLT